MTIQNAVGSSRYQRLVDRWVDLSRWPTAKKTVLAMAAAAVFHLATVLVAAVVLTVRPGLVDLSGIGPVFSTWVGATIVILLLALPAARRGAEARWTVYLVIVAYCAIIAWTLLMLGVVNTPWFANAPLLVLLVPIYWDVAAGRLALAVMLVALAVASFLEISGYTTFVPITQLRVLEARRTLGWHIAAYVSVWGVAAYVFLMMDFSVSARERLEQQLEALHETVRRQAAELEKWNRELTTRVESQLTELGRLARLKRFFSAPVADVIARDDEALLRPHRRGVTVVSIDLRGFTAFAESSEPEEVMGVLREYHKEMGQLITTWGGTLEHFAGDGIMVVFNDPVEVPNPEERAVRMTLAMRDAVETLRVRWTRRGFDLGVGFGISSGYATAGVIGFDQRWAYSVIGTVMNQAARLNGAAAHGQILVSERLLAAVESFVESEPVGDITLKGLRRPLATFNLSARRERGPVA